MEAEGGEEVRAKMTWEMIFENGTVVRVNKFREVEEFLKQRALLYERIKKR